MCKNDEILGLIIYPPPNCHFQSHNFGKIILIREIYFQYEINKKRDTELSKLRKLLEDVHIESEETAGLLRKKHQEVVIDFQDQLDQLAKAKAR